MSGPLTIGVDARDTNALGVRRYFTELLRYLGQIDNTSRFIVYTTAMNFLKDNDIHHPNMEAVVIPGPIFHPLPQVRLRLRVAKDHLDLLHATSAWGVPVVPPHPLVVTVHDTLSWGNPALLSFSARLYGRFVHHTVKRAAVRLILVSHADRRAFLRVYPEMAARAVVVYHGISPEFRQVQRAEELESVQAKYGISREYILHIGVAQRHKNVQKLIEAYGLLPAAVRNRYQLVLVSPRGLGHREVIEQLTYGHERGLLRLIHATPEDLPALYSGARVFVFPSLHESFGLPLLEAMACGTPVVASHIPAHVEIAAGAARLIDPNDAPRLCDALLEILFSEPLRTAFIHKGFSRVTHFSWQATATAHRAIYEEILSAR